MSSIESFRNLVNKGRVSLGFLIDIKNEEQSLYDYICLQIEKASFELDNVQNIFSEYTDHSTSHARTVLENGEKLNAVYLNIYEKAIFILSSYFHDIGMNIPQYEIDMFMDKLDTNTNLDFYLNNISASQELGNENISITDKKYFIALNYFREKHSDLSAKRILELYPKNDKNSFINNKYIWDCVSKICKAHAVDISFLKTDPNYMDDYYIEGGIVINILYLTILLRLADICHFSRDRAYPYILKDKIFKSEKSKKIWEYYSNIITTTTNKEANIIRIQADCENFFQHRAIINDIKNIQDELLNSHKILISKKSEYQLPWKYIDDSLVRPSLNSNYKFCNLKFELNNNKIIYLLMGERLYGDSLYALRECIQNAVDAIKVVSKKVNSNHYIYLQYYEEDYPILEIFDSGTGMNMDIISLHFLSVGSKSYWMSEKGIEEWDINQASFGLIADHGIGALSYFMLAKQIEIYTKYLKSNDFIHVKIDDYNNNILCDNIDISRFPIFTTSYDIKSPWDQGHGTCIKFILKKKLEFDKLLIFLATNILRCPVNLYLNFSKKEYDLKNIWHFREYDKFNKHEYDLIFSEKIPSNMKLYDSLYNYRQDYYKGPPQDKSIEYNEISCDFFYGKIHINYSNNSEPLCRISQNGILIKNAEDFFSYNKQSKTLMNAYGIDLEINGGKIFQLNAERTNIINSEYNQSIFDEIENLLNKKYYQNISMIESSVYFKCGGIFYHGMPDIIFDISNSATYFHENLYNIFTNEDNHEFKMYYHYFNSAKLYMTGIARCRPVSVDDIKRAGLRNLVIFKMQNLTTKGLSKMIHGEKIINIEKFKTKIGIDITDSTIYLPDNNYPFMLPLYKNFNFTLQNESDFAYLVKLSDGCFTINDPLRLKLENIWGNVEPIRIVV